MRKSFFFILLAVVLLISAIFFITDDNDFSGEEINKIIGKYSNEDFISLKDQYVSNYFKEYYYTDEIIDFEILYNDNSCVTLFFLPYDVSKETIETCNRFFTKHILLTSDVYAGPVILNADLRKKLNHKNFMVYIGDRLAMNYNYNQKEYSIIDSQITEDYEYVYKQRMIKDELKSYIMKELKKIGYRNINIEKSFNNNFLIVRMKGNSVDEAEEFFSSSEFGNEIRKSKHDFLDEIRIILNSKNNDITSINLEKDF